LSTVKLGQKVKVYIDKGKDEYTELPGTVTWISDKAEFTPKTIQTKEERCHLVYAVKIKVANDGAIKLGMYGEVKF
jgi:HlyD family secretion protein